MKKLLSTVTSALLFNFTNSGYATPDTYGLNDFPDEIKLHIALQLPLEDQKNLGMANKSFNAITADDTVLTQKTARRLGINFDHIDQFSKEFFKDVRANNITIDLLSSIEAPYMTIDDTGHVKPMGYPTRYDYHDLLVNRAFKTTCINSDQNVLAGSRREPREYSLNMDGYTGDEAKFKKIAVKYIPDEGMFIDLFPGDERDSHALALNKDGSIVVGVSVAYINQYETVAKYGIICNGHSIPSGFVYKNARAPIALDFSQDERASSYKMMSTYISYPLTLSNAGEIVAGFSTEFWNRPLLTIADHYVNSEFSERTGETRYQPYEINDTIDNSRAHAGEIIPLSASATIWFNESKGDLDRYHPCSLQDLVVYACSDAQRADLQYIHLSRVLAISPNGKAMLVSAQYDDYYDEMPDDRKETLGDLCDKEFFLKIVFGLNVKSE